MTTSRRSKRKSADKPRIHRQVLKAGDIVNTEAGLAQVAEIVRYQAACGFPGAVVIYSVPLADLRK